MRKAPAKDTFGDARLKRNAGAARAPRESADVARVQQDGSALTAEERRRQLRQEWVQEVLPTPPKIPGMHVCWLSTTNSTDPVFKRIQRGYVPVKASEVPGFGAQYTAQGGEFDGCIACNEMLLFKIPEQLFSDLMTIYHHDMPIEQEESIRETLERAKGEGQDKEGNELLKVEGDFENLGRAPARLPTFIS